MSFNIVKNEADLCVKYLFVQATICAWKMSQKNISLVILTYNRNNVLEENLKSLQCVKHKVSEVLVVDNGSTDGTVELVRHKYPDVKLYENKKNQGAVGRNTGLREASGDIIITFDDDVIGITAKDIEFLEGRFLNAPKLGAVCFKVVQHDNNKICNWCHHRIAEKYADKTFLTYEISEGAVAYRREALESAGYYPEEFFISHEGLDLAYRIMNAGYIVIYDGSITVRHKHDPLGRLDWRRYYYDTRNLLWVAARNMPLSYAIKYLFLGLSSMFIYSVRDGYFLYWLRAVRDGILGLQQAFRNRKKWTYQTREICREIDKHRPSLLYMVKQRLFKKGVSI